MTNTTSVQQLIRERRVYLPQRLSQPGIATLIPQSIAGWFLGSFLVELIWILFRYDKYNGFVVLRMPFVMVCGLAAGPVVGLLIWMFSRLARGPLHVINRSSIAILVSALGWFAIWLWVFGDTPTPEAQLWLLEAIVIPGIVMGLVTGSRLRLWRELVRRGEASGKVLTVLAGFTGAILRVPIVLLFMTSLLVLISELQVDYRLNEYSPASLVPIVLTFTHFALGAVVLFVRVRFSVLALLTAVAVSPLIVSLTTATQVQRETYYIFFGYVAVWAMFLLTRWRQTQLAFSFLNEEFRYYLID
jgi:hypothetical protein